MSEETVEFFSPVGPTVAKIFNIAVAATSTPIDLTGSDYTALKTAIDASRLVTLVALGDVWYRWATATGTVVIASTAASNPTTQGVLLPAGAERVERPPPGATFLIAIGPVATTLSLYVSSRGINEDMKSS